MTYKTGDKVKLEGTVKDTLAEGRLLVEIAGAGIIVPSCRVIPESVLTEDEASDYRAGDFEPALEPTAKVELEHDDSEKTEVRAYFQSEGTEFSPVENATLTLGEEGLSLTVDESVADEVGVPFSAVSDEPVVEKPKRGRKKAE